MYVGVRPICQHNFGNNRMLKKQWNNQINLTYARQHKADFPESNNKAFNILQ